MSLKKLRKINRNILRVMKYRAKSFFNGIRIRFILLINSLKLFYHCFFKKRAVVISNQPHFADEDSLILDTSFNLMLQVLTNEASIDWYLKNIDLKEEGKRTIPEKEFLKNKDQWIIKHLDWEATLDSPDLSEYEQVPHQAQAARVLKELYIWWTQTRPNRMNPSEVQDITGSPSYEVRDNYYEEDTAMLVKLISVRASLWV